jgi:transposase
MLVVESVVRIRREHAGGKPIKAIARDLRLSRKVVRKAIRAPEGAFDYHRTIQPLPRIGPFQERLDKLLVENEARSRRDRLRMTRIHDLLLREGFDGSYDAVRRYAARWTAEQRKDVGDGIPAFIPLLFRPGEAYQFDWSHEDDRDRRQANAGEGRTYAAMCIAGGLRPRLSTRDAARWCSTRMRAGSPSLVACPCAASTTT